ncbi:MAG TPA: polysaccharide biosynthesis C-terminal domain-containing protein [Planctomycetota bacterium]|nr:polysaccharide biosynthesis C-terminal domain-containing protein [Planctomycetota bacterium]
MNFRRWVVFVFLVHVLVVVIDKGGGLVLYLLTSNRPDQHGESNVIASLPFILMAIANLGLATSLVYFVRRRRFTAQHVFETTLTVALTWGVLVGLLAALVTLYVLPRLDPDWQFDPWLVWPFCAAVPLLLVGSYANSVQLATDQVRGYGAVHLVSSFTFLPAFFVCFFWLGGDVSSGHVPLGVAWGRLISTFIVVLVTLWMVRRVVKLRLGLHLGFLREGVRYGWKANITSTLTYLNHRIDLLVLAALFVPPVVAAVTASDLKWQQVAFYGMSVTWAELVWHFPDALRDLFFSKVASSSHAQARELTPVLARLGLAVSVLASIAIVLLIDPVMTMITIAAGKGASVWPTTWSPTVTRSLVVLIPGTVAYTVSKVLQADLAARDRLQVCVNAQVIVLVIMLALDFVWMPAHGAVGAAAASTIAYASSTLYTVWAYARDTDTSAWACLFFQRADVRYVREIARAVASKLRRSLT